jgi:hypothetical protein
MKTSIQFILTPLTFLCLAAIGPVARAVVPAPDGGYAGGNTAEGQSTLLSLTTGGFNTAVGFFSLRNDMTGSFNTAIGAGTLLANTADSNTATGVGALLSNTTGAQNTANGAFALFFNTTGFGNTAAGAGALQSNTTGNENTATGAGALFGNTTGAANAAFGRRALFNNTEGLENTAVGYVALFSNTTGLGNTATGYEALELNTSGQFNTANGNQALLNNTGDANTGMGRGALGANTTGSENTAVGINALFSNTTGSHNVAVGSTAGSNQTMGSNNVYIGAGEFGIAGESNACYIASIFGQTSVGGVPVLINGGHKLGTTTSSKRFKEAIKPMDRNSEAVFSLQPVTFRYKKEIDPKGTSQFGLVAEDVEKINPDLVVRDEEGKPYSVRYDQVNAMLLNEFLKEHKRVEELNSKLAKQEAIIAQQQEEFRATTIRQENEIHELAASVKQQSAQLQHVSVQFELGKAAPRRVIANDP